MVVDHFFAIGTPHANSGGACEDYARSGLATAELAVGAVADGCSGASANTEVGAQAAVFAFERALLPHRHRAGGWFDAPFAEDFLAAFGASRVSPSEDDYLASLVGFAATSREAAIYLFGDGAIALRYADGRHLLIEIEWAGNAPYYPGYGTRPELRKRFLAQLSDPYAAVVQRRTEFVAGGGDLTTLAASSETQSFEALERGTVMRFYPADEKVEALAVMTDGLARVGRLSAAEATAELLAFKNHRGQFVKRRCLRALAAFRRGGQLLGDDLAMAGVWFGSE
jgi:hypothetical protein